MWIAIVSSPTGGTLSTQLSETHVTAVAMPEGSAWSVAAEPVTESTDGKRVRITLTKAGVAAGVFVVADTPREGEFPCPWFCQIPRDGCEPLITIGVGKLRSDDGGGIELARAA